MVPVRATVLVALTCGAVYRFSRSLQSPADVLISPILCSHPPYPCECAIGTIPDRLIDSTVDLMPTTALVPDGPRSIMGVFMFITFAFAAQAQPDFSGLWQLNVEKSTLRAQVPKELLVKIDHRDPNLTQTMLIVAADGSEQQQTFTYETNGYESRTKLALGEGQSRAHWNGSELVIDSVLTTPSRTFHFSDHWSLSWDGQTLQMAHRDDDLAGQVAVFEKASPTVAARFKPQ
jgi:hypothetical protein